MNVREAVNRKRAVRQFTSEALKDDEIHQILNAGRRAQSSKNTQPWHFIAIRDFDTLQKLSDTRQNLKHVAGAALCVVIVLPDEDRAVDWLMFDAGQAAANMQLAAIDLGIGSCLGAIHNQDAARDLLGFPDDWSAHILISFGYPLDDALSRPLKPGGRRSMDEVVHWDQW